MNDELGRSWGRFSASLAALAAVVVGIPAFLVTCSRVALGSWHPVPAIGSVDEIRTWIERELSAAEMVPILLRSLLIVGWVLWILLLSSVVGAVITSRPRFGHVSLPTLPVFDGFAAWIAAGLTALSSFAPNLSALAATDVAPPVPSSFVTSAVSEEPGFTVAAATRGAVPPGFVRVGTGDSLPSIAQRTLGDTERWGELWELRDQHDDNGTGTRWIQPWRLEAGWLLKLPAAPSGVDPATSVSPIVSTHIVRTGESVFAIAMSMTNGDNGRAVTLTEEIIELNLGGEMNDGSRFTDPAVVQPGWELVLPNPAVVSDRAPSDGFGADPSDEAGSNDAYVRHVVVEGDTLFDISGEHLGDTDAWTRIWEENRGAGMGDGRAFTDPDVILPGWELDIPSAADYSGPSERQADTGTPDRKPDPPDLDAPAGDVVAPSTPDTSDGSTEPDGVDGSTDDVTVPSVEDRVADAEPSDATADRMTPIETTVDERDTADGSEPDTSADGTELDPGTSDGASVPPNDEAGSPGLDPPTRGDEVEAPGVGRETDGLPAPTTTDPVVPGATGEAGGSTTPGDPAPRAPSPIRLEHAALLAAGVLTLVAVRRQRALRAALPHSRVPAPPDDVAATERRLRTVDPGERAARVDVAVRAIAHRLAGNASQVGSVRIAPDGELIVRLTQAAQLAAPWVGDGATWTLPASVPIEMLSDDARRVGQPCLALVTVGVDTEGRDVLVDLEAAGVTVVEAQPDQADEIVRAIGSGLATSLTSEVVHLVVAGLGVECLFDHPNTRQLASVDEVVQESLGLAGSTVANERTSFDLRARRTGGEMWEPAVMLFASADDAATGLVMSSLPAPGHGIAAVVAASPGDLTGSCIYPGAESGALVGARVIAHADRWVLDAFGEQIDLLPIGLSEADVQQLGDVLDDAELPIEPAPFLHVEDDVAEPVGDSLEVIDHRIVVSLMGGVEIATSNGEPAKFERSKTVELIAWLATHRERATRRAARTALWELDVRDATFANVVSEARRGLARLVTPPDEGEWLARTLNESLPLHELVVTDADLIRQRVQHAQLAPPAHAIDVLRPAVAMIRDMPFANTSYLWPDADGITSNLVLLATTAAAELAGHALSMGDTELVFWATGQGLKVLSGHEELIGIRMRAHARAGDLAGVRQEWESYERVIMADSWSDGEPAPKLLDLRRELLSSS